ncbi:YkgJ family cysteine cluster protein [Aquabacterium sp.]|jgi:Fe-S-cluster containining protein|uniref:YkgJ family cysteine cluster protein n=1 Tax=Aquabacterium sp. TaxID=1872578 RepID=UPI0025C05759|nr:YkgJ family cysteine cluster protein [Aquabacterium sp.]
MDCQRCGACCAQFRVSFYWAEADDAPGGTVPVGLTETVSPHTRCMQGTWSSQPRCTALEGDVGRHVGCRIYDLRPTPCRQVTAGDAQCLKARAAHGLSAEAPSAST